MESVDNVNLKRDDKEFARLSFHYMKKKRVVVWVLVGWLLEVFWKGLGGYYFIIILKLFRKYTRLFVIF